MMKFCPECGADIREFDGECPYCSGRLKRGTDTSFEDMSDEERAERLKRELGNMPPPPGMLNPDGTLPTELINARNKKIDSIVSELWEIEKRKPGYDPEKWQCICGADNTNIDRFCKKCGRAKPIWLREDNGC